MTDEIDMSEEMEPRGDEPEYRFEVPCQSGVARFRYRALAQAFADRRTRETGRKHEVRPI